MDRLFLRGLAQEIGEASRGALGARVRAVRIPGRLSLALRLGRPGSPELVTRLGPGVSGLYLAPAPRLRERATDREVKLSRLVDGAEVRSIAASPVDRRVSVELEARRPSGRSRRLVLEIELFATRSALFLVEPDAGLVVDVLAHGEPRHRAGERYVPPEAPPDARGDFAAPEEYERGLASSHDRKERVATGIRCGLTPLLSRELVHRLEHRDGTPAGLFGELVGALERPTPAVYFERGGARITLSPIELDALEQSPCERFESFNEAMLHAATLTDTRDREASLRRRLDAAVGRKRTRSSRLERKLLAQRGALTDADALRRRGETLLAGMGVARRLDETHVRVPDPYDPDGGDVVLQIDPRFDLAANAERSFRRARKVERTGVELAARLGAVERELGQLDELSMSVADAVGAAELEDLVDEAETLGVLPRARSKPSRPARTKRYRRFTGPEGGVILVGRSARGNDELTFRVAKASDLWLHALGIPGSHVVLSQSSGTEAAAADVRAAGALAAYFSKARGEDHVDVMVTERKRVSRIPGGAPGLVRVASSRTLRVSPREADGLVETGEAEDGKLES